MAEINYSDLTEEQLDIINEYCENNMKKLKIVCYLVWGKKGLPYMYHDDLYDDAMNVLSESVITFNPDRGACFKTYLTNNIHMSYGQWYRDTHLRSKRSNLLLDKNGKIKKDKKGNPIIIHNVSLDAPTPDCLDMIERISLNYNLEDEIIGSNKSGAVSDKIREYLNNLPKDQREVAYLIMDGYSCEEIKEILHIEQSEFTNYMNGLRAYRNISILF